MSRSPSRGVSAPLLRTALSADHASRSGSRPRYAPHSSTNSIPVGVEDLVNPSGGAPISEEEAELFQDLVRPHQHHEHHHALDETLVQVQYEVDNREEGVPEFDSEWRQKQPWYIRPSPWWFLSYVPFAAIAMTVTMAAKVELFTYLVCLAMEPDVSPDKDDRTLLLVARRMSAAAFGAPNQRVCAADPAVQAVVAQLNTAMTTIMGVLTCVTTGWWGSLSDRYGRTRVLGCAVIGILTMDFSFIATFWFFRYIRGGYWLLLIGPIVEGCLGGQVLISATIHAYIADCTTPAMRSGIFALNLGLLFTGVGIGPLIGGLIIRFTGNFIIVFYISAIIHAIYALLVWFVIPESLSKAEMLDARARHKVANEEYLAAHAHGGVLVFFKRMFSFLTPLAIFLPFSVDGGGSPAKGQRRDWNLLFVALSYGCVISLLGIYLYVIQYIEGAYGWNTEQVGYWFSAVGAARAMFLTLIFPVVVRFFKPKPAVIQLPTEADEPLTNPTDASFPVEESARTRSPSTHEYHHDASFDLKVAKFSVFVEALVYFLMVLSSSGLMFAVIGVTGALGMGFGPALQSVALTLYNRRGGKDSGKLFGAMSVVQALSSQVFGPFVYGLTYMKTVRTYPKTMFLVAFGTITTSFFLLQLVRLPKDTGTTQRPAEDEDVEEQLLSAESVVSRIGREDTLVGSSDEPLIAVDGEYRGRKVAP